MDRVRGSAGWRGAIGVLAWFWILGSVAQAQRGGPSSDQVARDKAARDHYTQGILHYDLGEIDQAIADFKQAYAISAAPGLLFNIAQAYRYKKDYEQSLHFYRTYLRLSPKAINRRDVEERLAELEKLVEEGQKAQSGRPHGIIQPGGKADEQHGSPAPATLTRPPPARDPGLAETEAAQPAPTPPPATTVSELVTPVPDRSLRAFMRTPTGHATVAIGAVGVVSLITAAALGSTVLSVRDDYGRGCDGGRCDDAVYDQARGMAIATDVLLGVGAAAAITGVILLAVRPGLRARVLAHQLGVKF